MRVKKTTSPKSQKMDIGLMLGILMVIAGGFMLYLKRYTLASACFLAASIAFMASAFGLNVPNLFLYVLFPAGALKKFVLLATNGRAINKYFV